MREGSYVLEATEVGLTPDKTSVFRTLLHICHSACHVLEGGGYGFYRSKLRVQYPTLRVKGERE